MRRIALILIGILSVSKAAAGPDEDPGWSFQETLATSESRPQLSARISDLLIYAISLSGIPYRYGGKNPREGFDCSGFVSHVFKAALNFSLPTNALAMSRIGQSIATSELSPGDLVFFNTMSNPYSHVGIYIGDERFIHSPRSGGKIEIVHMRQPYWASRFDGARRFRPLE